ncbi:MAG: hypothetical protein KDA84_11390 [Planctomycetaceae bacterium]|nr:hypothetical protein [Planctomycetaceae bacterium]
MVAALFGDPQAPIAKFLNAHAGRLIGAEVVVTMITGLGALVVDRMQSRREESANSSEKANKT